MRNFITFTISFLLLFSAAKAVDFNWEELRGPEGGELYFTLMDSTGNYWGCTTQNGLYFRAKDSDSWTIQDYTHDMERMFQGFVTPDNEICLYSTDDLLYSSDEGTTWEKRPFPSPFDTKAAFQFDGKSTFFLLTVEKFFYYSTDKGLTWEYLKGLGGKIIFSYGTSPNAVFANYLEMMTLVCARTSDNGETWENLNDKFEGLEGAPKGFSVVKYHHDGYVVVAVASKDTNNKTMTSLHFSEDDGETWKMIATARIDSGSSDFLQQNNPFPHSGRLIKWSLTQYFKNITVFDDSFTIEVYQIDSREERKLEETKVPELDNNGLHAVNLYSIHTGMGSAIYGKSSDEFFKLNIENDDWEQIKTPNEDNDYELVGITSSDKLFVFGGHDSTFKLYDGQEWEITSAAETPKASKFYFQNDVLLYTLKYSHYSSLDFGETVNDVSKEGLFEDDPFSHGFDDYIVGTGDVYFRTSTQRIEESPNTYKNINTFLSKTTDGGQSWIELIDMNERFKENKTLRVNAKFSPSGRLYFCSNHKFTEYPLLVSYDNGESFEECIEGLNIDDRFSTMFFSTTEDYSILLTNKDSYLSLDGKSWTKIKSNMSVGYASLCFTDDGGIYVLDDLGNLFKTTIPLDVKDKQIPAKISFFPNPVDSRMQVNFADELQSQATIKLISLQGVTVYKEKISPGETITTIDTSVLQTGMYILTVSTGDKVYTEKVIVK